METIERAIAAKVLAFMEYAEQCGTLTPNTK